MYQYSIEKNKFTKSTFYKLLESINSDFDMDKSLRAGNFNIMTREGKFQLCGGFNHFCTTYNSMFTDILDMKKTFKKGTLIYVFLKDIDTPPKDLLKKEGVKAPSIKETAPLEAPLISLDIDEDISEDEVVPLITPDYEWMSSLDNTSEDKLALDKYAESTFDIKLRRNKRVENMIEDFKKVYDK